MITNNFGFVLHKLGIIPKEKVVEANDYKPYFKKVSSIEKADVVAWIWQEPHKINGKLFTRVISHCGVVDKNDPSRLFHRESVVDTTTPVKKDRITFLDARYGDKKEKYFKMVLLKKT